MSLSNELLAATFATSLPLLCCCWLWKFGCVTMANKLYGGSATWIQPSLGGNTGIGPCCSVLGLCFVFRLLNPLVPAYSCIQQSHENSTEEKLVAQQAAEVSGPDTATLAAQGMAGKTNQVASAVLLLRCAADYICS